ncbi:MAG: alpha/beta hydrolase [Leptolyngbya sp. SIO1D8]|nr:alpha/beta hydrolase [Leptolyngbya sp. SIO1D8]
MFIAPGFEQRSIVTDLGTIAYAAPQPELWPIPAHPDETLIFMHGLGGGSSSYEWSKVYPAFATDCRVIAPDLLGWGNSEHPKRDYQIEDYQDAIAQFLQKLVPQKAAVVIASSWTAAMMVRIAVDSPEHIKALILVAPSGLSDFGQDFQQGLLPQILRVPGIDQLLYRGAIATAPGIQAFLAERQFANADLVAPEMVSAYLASASQPNADFAALSFVREDLCFDLAEWIPRLSTPTTILWGQTCQFTPIELGQKLVDLNPEIIQQFEMLENLGLTPQLEQPSLTIALIQKALKRFQAFNTEE